MDIFGELRTIIINLSPTDELDQRRIVDLISQATASEPHCNKVLSIADRLEELVLPLAIAAAVGSIDTLTTRKEFSLRLVTDLQIACSFKGDVEQSVKPDDEKSGFQNK